MQLEELENEEVNFCDRYGQIYHNMTTSDDCGSFDIQAVLPGIEVDLSPFGCQMIKEIYGEGTHPDGEWFYGKLKDGRYFYYSDWFDYTFWGGQVIIGRSKEEIERFGLGKFERDELGLVLED